MWQKRVNVTFALLAALGTVGAKAADDAQLKGAVAKSLGYYAPAAAGPRYSVSEPWRSLAGQMICARLDLPDGRGGYAPSSDYSMFQFDENGRIVAVVKDNTLFGCPNRSYSELAPTRR